MKRRDLLLQSMGITQWELAKPQVLKGDAQICLDEKIRLVVICEENQQRNPLFLDLFYALMLQKGEYCWATAEQLQRFTFKHRPLFLLLNSLDKHHKAKLADQQVIDFPSWQSLQTSTHKRELWRKLDTLFIASSDID